MDILNEDVIFQLIIVLTICNSPLMILYYNAILSAIKKS